MSGADGDTEPDRRLMELLPHMVYEMVTRGERSWFRYVSRGAVALGLHPVSRDPDVYRVEDLVAMIHPDDLGWVNEQGMRSVTELEPFEGHYRLLPPDGRVLWVDGRSRVQRLPDGDVVSLGTITDITAMKRTEDELQRETERLELAAEAGGVGLFEVQSTADGRRRMLADAKVHELHGLPPGALNVDGFHRVLMTTVPESEWRRYWADFTAYQERREPRFDFDLTVVPRPGLRRTVRMHLEIEYLEGGGTRVLGAMWDVTDEVGLVAEMAAAKEAAEAAERAKGEFLAVMSHEIRTPLNAVLGMTHLALKTDLSVRQRGYLEKIELSTRSLMSIISDVLDFSKIEAGALELESGDVVVARVLESVAAVTVVRAEEKGLELVFRVAAEVPSVVVGDGLRLGQVLVNLVSNAVKFTDAGGVLVVVSGGGGSLLRVDVSDSGVGLSAGGVFPILLAPI